ncbi:MAG: OmpA family protein [Oligosphaeraceae bacterium]|nr:OmpA family protein [Oligosphaeraceae bacterium]
MLGKLIKPLLAVLLVSLFFTACTKKPKIDLSGLRESPAGSSALRSGTDQFGGQGFEIVDGSEPLFGEFKAGDANGAGAVLSGEGWGDLGQPLAAAAGGDGFLLDSQPWNEVVYFAYDRSEVSPSERYKLDALAQVLLAAPEKALIIEGHCDERGSDEYNRALSERRALSVREYLSNLGVAIDRMQTISYGEDRPVVPDARNEADHQKNRRAQFLLGKRR